MIRIYAPNGVLLRDTLATRTYETQAPSPSPCGGADKHAEAEAYQDWPHRYGLIYEYDLAGRRTKLIHPDGSDPCTGSCQQLYKYNTTTGTLDTLVHPSPAGSTLTTRFVYDNQLRLLTTYHPGSVSTTLSYDSDGRVATRAGPSITDALTYEASGRVISGTVYVPLVSTNRTLSLGYSGLGALQWSQGLTESATNEEFKTDALGNRLWVRDPGASAGIDRTRYPTYDAATGQVTTTALGSGGCGTPGAGVKSCHPAWYGFVDTVSYDASGNQAATWGKTTLADQTQIAQESRSYYAADERLTYYDRHDGWGTPGLASGVFEEYRYDALGRRVLVRSRRPSSCASPCEAYTQRTVWDGDQVLYELRASAQAGYLEGDGLTGPGEDQNLVGIVAYAHGPGLDQPVGVLKKYTTTSWAYVTPHQNWQGDWNHGSFSTGALCLAVGATCPSWPGDVQLADNGTADFPTAYTVWWGTLIQGGANGSGLQYLRNRYYDPARGRFTQLDPIGLGGGLNLYGFASGDPVNFSDPFGLCESCTALQKVMERIAGFLRSTPGRAVSALAQGMRAMGSAFSAIPGIKNFSESLSGINSDGGRLSSRQQYAAAAMGFGEIAASEALPRILFKGAHGARHLIGTGLGQGEVEVAIERQVVGEIRSAGATGNFEGRISVRGQMIQYRGYTLPGGNINIGTYFPLK